MFADLTDTRCYYELLGSGDPLLLVPGLGSTGNLWDCVAPELAENFGLILVDNRGMGRSLPKRPPQTLEDLAVDLVELLDHLQLDRVHVMGLSLGGMIAQQFALDHPSRVDRLVLVSCSNRFGPYLRQMAKLLAQALRRFPSSVFRRTVELLGTAPQYLDTHAEEIELKLATVQAPARMTVAKQLRCLARHDVKDPKDYRVTAPTLVIAGQQDNLIPACYGRRMADEIPGSEFVIVPDCGHNPFVEQPDIVLPRITEFLMRSRVSRVTNRYESRLEFDRVR